MINVVQALELLEISAAESAAEESGQRSAADRHLGPVSLTARALATRQLTVAELARWPLADRSNAAPGPFQPAMSVGALIVFRTAHRFGCAGASTERTLDAVYCAAHRYVEMIPPSLQDDVDKVAIGELMAEVPAPGVLPGL